MIRFAYAFHLLVFFMVEGFFAIRSMKYNFKIWLSKKAMILMVPYFLWVIISFIVSNLDNGDIVKKYYLSIFLNQVNLRLIYGLVIELINMYQY